jgi:hypothetical protein
MAALGRMDSGPIDFKNPESPVKYGRPLKRRICIYQKSGLPHISTIERIRIIFDKDGNPKISRYSHPPNECRGRIEEVLKECAAEHGCDLFEVSEEGTLEDAAKRLILRYWRENTNKQY